jgi:mannose-1-phosphate guanylyltransferase
VTVAEGARVSGTVVLPGASIGAGAEVTDCAIGAGATIGAGAVLADAVVGDQARVGPGNELRHGARIWPAVTLPPTAVRFSADV